MAVLSVALQYYIHLRLNNDPGWEKIKVFYLPSSIVTFLLYFDFFIVRILYAFVCAAMMECANFTSLFLGVGGLQGHSFWRQCSWWRGTQNYVIYPPSKKPSWLWPKYTPLPVWFGIYLSSTYICIYSRKIGFISFFLIFFLAFDWYTYAQIIMD